jgi:hypothetical protein
MSVILANDSLRSISAVCAGHGEVRSWGYEFLWPRRPRLDAPHHPPTAAARLQSFGCLPHRRDQPGHALWAAQGVGLDPRGHILRSGDHADRLTARATAVRCWVDN